jgi:membrane protease YdiL (CAAX protease family)
VRYYEDETGIETETNTEAEPKNKTEEAPEGTAQTAETADIYNDGSGRYVVYNGVKYLPDRFFIFSFTSYVFVFIIPALFYIKFKGEGYTKRLNLKLPKLNRVPLAVYGLAALISGTAFAGALVNYMGGTLQTSAMPFVSSSAGGNPVYDIGAAIIFVFLPAVCEEFMFRTVMSREYERYGAVCACLATSAAFAMSGFSPALFPLSFFSGIILYILAKSADCVILSMIAHAGYNFFNMYLWENISAVLKFEQNRFIFMFLSAGIFLLSVIFALNKIEKIYYNKAYENQPLPEKLTIPPPRTGLSETNGAAETKRLRAVFQSFFSPTFLAAAIIFFIYVSINKQ